MSVIIAALSGSINYSANQEFITDGLVLNLNPSDANSYPGTGSTWYDLSGYNNHATLYNNPTHNANEFVFNGTNYAQIPDANSLHLGTNNFTISIWTKGDFITNENQGVLISKSEYYFELFLYNSYPYGWLGFPTYSIGSSSQVNNQQWYNYVLVRRGNDFYIYSNSKIKGSSNAPVDVSGVGQDIGIARRPNGEFPFNGSVGQIGMYNRSLSDAEIAQNFRALKSQYGL